MLGFFHLRRALSALKMTQSAAKSQRGNAAQGGVGVARVTKLCCQVGLGQLDFSAIPYGKR